MYTAEAESQCSIWFFLFPGVLFFFSFFFLKLTVLNCTPQCDLFNLFYRKLLLTQKIVQFPSYYNISP